MRRTFLMGIVAAGAVILAPALMAQRARQAEFGAFGSFTRYDRTLTLDNEFGGGGRFGYFLNDHVSLEVEGGYQQPTPWGGGTAATLTLLSASLAYNFGGERNLFYILGGYSQVTYGKSAPYDFSESAAHGALGDRVFISEHLALRLEARAVYTPKTDFPGGDWVGHVVGSLGLSLFTGSGRMRDADIDGVADRKDACPNTVSRATVDERGCPNDTDRDGVYNGLDTCPNTPTGAQTDGTGCPLDADKDQVFDGIDQCPATPVGAGVDGKGCPTDSDADTVPDGIDQCPNTPSGAVVEARGCPTDGDKDAVFDGIDRCPNTPAGLEVDAVGCQLSKDTDGDSIDDTKDRCPGTAAGTRVDAAGCPILFENPRTPVILRGVTFETGRSALRPESFTVLDIVAQSLNGNPEIRIEIAGYTDNTGSAAGNLRLSLNRAAAVRAYLAGKGVALDRMVAKGYGIANPVAPNTTAAGRASNRRVELHQLP